MGLYAYFYTTWYYSLLQGQIFRGMGFSLVMSVSNGFCDIHWGSFSTQYTRKSNYICSTFREIIWSIVSKIISKTKYLILWFNNTMELNNICPLNRFICADKSITMFINYNHTKILHKICTGIMKHYVTTQPLCFKVTMKESNVVTKIIIGHNNPLITCCVCIFLVLITCDSCFGLYKQSYWLCITPYFCT